MWTFLWKHVPNGYGLGSKHKWTHSKLKLEKVKANMFPSLQNGFTLSHNKIFLPPGQTFVAHLFWEEVFFWGWVWGFFWGWVGVTRIAQVEEEQPWSQMYIHNHVMCDFLCVALACIFVFLKRAFMWEAPCIFWCLWTTTPPLSWEMESHEWPFVDQVARMLGMTSLTWLHPIVNASHENCRFVT
jgi:hypothetical protein